MSVIYDETARVISVEPCARDAFRCRLHAVGIARAAIPFQFVNVLVSPGTDPFLRRPFSLSGIDKESGVIEITWAVVGKGTQLMTLWEPGREVMVLGPLGNGLNPELLPSNPEHSFPGKAQEKGRMLLVAGGMGVAPMGPLAEAATKAGWKATLFYGTRSSVCALDVSPFKAQGCQVFMTTDDGSLGLQGSVVQGLASWLGREPLEGEKDPLLAVACGPRPMLAAVKNLCQAQNISLYVALEERMACGTGLCKGCAVKAAQKEEYLHVCTDGPVFPAGAVALEGGGDL